MIVTFINGQYIKQNIRQFNNKNVIAKQGDIKTFTFTVSPACQGEVGLAWFFFFVEGLLRIGSTSAVGLGKVHFVCDVGPDGERFQAPKFEY